MHAFVTGGSMLGAEWVVRRRNFLAGIVTSTFAGFPMSVVGNSQVLHNPFDYTIRRYAKKPLLNNDRLPAVVAPVVDLHADKFYSNNSGSIIDPEALAKNRAQTKGLHDFCQALSICSERWLASGGLDINAAQHGFRLADVWASKRALLGGFNEQGRATRRFALVGFAVSLCVLSAGSGRALSGAVRNWLRELAEVCATDSGRLKNNQLNWLAAGLVVVGTCLKDGDLYLSGLDLCRQAISGICDDGSLSLELARQERALYYHSYALSPLLLASYFSSGNGQVMFQWLGGRLLDLLQFTIDNIVDPKRIELLSGYRQHWSGVTSNSVPWVELALAQKPNDWLVGVARRLRPIRYEYLGGNQTILFGRQ